MRIRSPKMRTLLVFLLLLAGGAIINIAVAWGCAIFLCDVTDGWTMRSGASRLENGSVWGNFRLDRPGYFEIRSHVSAPPDEWEERWEDPSSLIEPWGRVPSQMEVNTQWEEFASGWPRPVLRSRLHINDYSRSFAATATPKVFPRDTLESGFTIQVPLLSREAILPTGMIWHGVVINTVFYAVLAWLVFALTIILRNQRRIRRGICPGCMYPVGTSDTCTECGKPIPGARRKCTGRSVAA